MRIALAATVSAVLLAGCGTPVNHATISGKPEVSISGTTPDAVKAAIINEMINRQYRISKDTPYEIAFDKPTDNAAAILLLGSKYDAVPNVRASYYITSTPPTVRVVADLAVITNAGSGFERRTDVNGNEDTLKIQMQLDGIKASLEKPAIAAAGPTTSRPKRPPVRP